jgi:hypothetical protein
VRIPFLCLLGLLFCAVAQGQQYPFIPITAPDGPKGCVFPFEDSHGGLWLAGCESGQEGLFYFDGTRFISPVKSGLPKMIVRGMVEDSDGGIWLSSTDGIYRVFKGQIEKMFDGVALAGITRVASDVFLATVGRSGDSSPADADLMRITRAQGGWKAEAIIKAVAQVQFRLDSSGHVL